VILVVVLPRHVDDAVDVSPNRVEGLVIEALTQTARELVPGELDVSLSLSH
jgi:hypothetical protein